MREKPRTRDDLRNLIDNAVKYGGKEPLVEIHTCWLGGSKPTLVIRVADNGPGIPMRQRRKIFRRFERLGVELERTKPGTDSVLHRRHARETTSRQR
ncbi:MAG: ATP-binding protein [Pirellulaceae bacterium]